MAYITIVFRLSKVNRKFLAAFFEIYFGIVSKNLQNSMKSVTSNFCVAVRLHVEKFLRGEFVGGGGVCFRGAPQVVPYSG